MRFARGFSLLMLTFLLAGAYGLPARGAASAKRVIIIAVDGATWEELRSPEFHNIGKLLDRSAVGVMNTKGPNDSDPASVWVTLGAGRGASAGDKPWAMEIRGSRRRLFSGPWRVGFGKIAELNQKNSTEATPGLLGEVLSSKGINDRVLVQVTPGPDMAPMLIADTHGTIPLYVDFMGVQDRIKAVGEILAEPVKNRYVVFSLTVPGPVVSPVYPTNRPITPDRMRVLRQADAVVGRVLESADNNTLIILLSPTCPQFMNNNVRCLSPIVYSGSGFNRGVLTSPSTRRYGMVANVDFAPTVLQFLEIAPPGEMTGQPVRSIASPTATADVDVFDWKMASVYRMTYEVGLLAPSGWIGAFLLALALRGLGLRWLPGARIIVQFFLLLFAAMPLALVLVGLLPLTSGAAYCLIASVIGIIVGTVVWCRTAFPASFGIVCGITATVLWIDTLLGTPLMIRSVMRSDPTISGRFYGLGNHEAGIFIGSVLLVIGVMLEARRWRNDENPPRVIHLWTVVVAVVAIFTVGASFAAANWGQGLTFAVACLTLWVLIAPKGQAYRRLAGAGALFVLSAAMFIGIDLLLPPARQSHLVLLVRGVYAEGFQALTPVMERKAQLALHFSTLSPFMLLSLPAFALITVLHLRPPRWLQPGTKRYPMLSMAIAASAIGALVGSLLNDSGVISGLAIIYFPFLCCINLILESTSAKSRCGSRTEEDRTGAERSDGHSRVAS